MQLYCTRPNCPSPLNSFPSLDNPRISRPIKQKYCSACRMEMILGGRYLPLSVLGKGGFGTAFLARDIDSPTKRKCVVKLFQPPVTLTSNQIEVAQRLFATEAKVLEDFGFKHPQIPNLYAYFPLLITNPLTNQNEELFYLVQEFIDGEDLERILERDGAFAEADIVEVLEEMLSVLDFVQREGAIHRDVKPSNIMKGHRGRLFLLDFGAVKEVATPSGSQRGPTTICSPDYAPPEQIMGGKVNETTDPYALAASCVVLLTDKPSSELRDSSTNTWNWRSHTSVSPAIADILDKMLEARPENRFPSAKAALSALLSVNQPQPQPQPSKPRSRSKPSPVKQKQPLSLLQFLGSAAFTGTEGGLLAIATLSLFESYMLIGSGLWLAMLAALVFLQVRRAIEGWDYVIIAVITMAIVIFADPLGSIFGNERELIAVVSIMTGGAMVLVAAFFRLVLRILTRIM